MWYWTYRIPDLSVTEHIIFWTYVSDTEPLGYWTLSDPINSIKPRRVWCPTESDPVGFDTTIPCGIRFPGVWYPLEISSFYLVGMVSEPTESDTVGYKNPWNLISRNLIIRGIRSRVVWYTLQIRSSGVWYPQESDPTTEKNPKGTTSEFKYLGEFSTKFENI
jgi:hypothetical protein